MDMGHNLLDKQYESFDVLKFVLSISVVAIHIDPLLNFSGTFIYDIYRSLISLSVPVFFIMTGFLISNKMSSLNFANTYENSSNTIIISHIRKLFKLYIIWNLIYLPLDIYYYFELHKSVIYAIADYLRGLIFVGEHHKSWMLWYLLSSIYALILVNGGVKRKWKKQTLLFIGIIIGAFGILITLFVNEYISLPSYLILIFNVIQKCLVSGRIFTGFFYIPLGMCLYDRKTFRRFVSLSLIVLGLLFEIWSPKIGFIYEIVGAVGLFEAAYSVHIHMKKFSNLKLRHMSTYIYLIHLLVWEVLYLFFCKSLIKGFIPFLITITFSIIISYVIMIVQNKFN